MEWLNELVLMVADEAAEVSEVLLVWPELVEKTRELYRLWRLDPLWRDLMPFLSVILQTCSVL